MAEGITIVIEGRDTLSPAAKSASTALDRVAQSGDRVHSSLGNVQKASDRAGSGFGNMVKSALGFAAGLGIFSAVQGAVSLASDAIVGFNGRMEQSEIAWTTMLGSASAAKTMLSDLQRFAAVTPFEFPELEQSSKRMMAMGFAAKDIIPLMTDVGNATAALGMGNVGISRITLALGQMQAKTKVSGEEMRQLAETGIPAWQMLADKLGKSVGETMKLSEEGKIASGVFIGAFREFSQLNYGGMMDKQARTFLGALSTIKDEIRLLASSAFRPLFDKLSEGAVKLADFLQTGEAAEWAERIGKVLGKVMSALEDMWRAWEQTFGRISNLAQSVAPAVVNFVADTFGGLLEWWDTNIPKLQQIVSRVLNAVQDFWSKHGDNIMSIARQAWEWIQGTVGNVLAAIGDVIDFALDVINGDWQGALENLVRLQDRAWGMIVDTAASGAKVLIEIWGSIGDMFKGIPAEVLMGLGPIGQVAQGFRLLGVDVRGSKGSIDALAASAKVTHASLAGLGGTTDKLAGTGAARIRNFANSFMRSIGMVRTEADELNDEIDLLMKPRTPVGGGAAKPQVPPGVPDPAKLKEVGLSIDQVKSALISLHPATLMAAGAVSYWEGEIQSVNLALVANQDQLKAAQAEYGRMSERLSELNRQLSDAQRRLTELSAPKLKGMGALDVQIGAVQKQLERVRFSEITGTPLEQVMRLFPILAQGGEQFAATLPKTEEELRKVLDILTATRGLKFDEQLKLIGDAAKAAQPELTFDQALKGIRDTRGEIGGLTGAIAAQEAAMRSQQGAINAIQAASEGLNNTLRSYQEQLKGAQSNQKLVNDALELGYDWLLKDRVKFLELGTAGERVAAIMDEKTRALLNSVTGAAKDTTGKSAIALETMVLDYRMSMAEAAMSVQGPDGKGGLVGTLGKIAPPIQASVAAAEGLKAAIEAIPDRDIYVRTHFEDIGGSIPGQGGRYGGSFTVPGFQGGGAFAVGGYGGPDSQLVAFRATPGERVSITPPGREPRETGATIIINNPTFWGMGEFEDMVLTAKARAERRGRW